MSKRSKADEEALWAAKFATRGEGVQNKSSSLELGPRYWPPLDDTTVLAIYPMHSSSPDSALLERSDFDNLSTFLLTAKIGQTFELAGPQNALRVEKLVSTSFLFSTHWNSTPDFTSTAFMLMSHQAEEMAAWMADKEAKGWEGWRSGRQELRSAPPSKADWALEIVVDRGTGYLADGEDTLYYRGPAVDGYEGWETMAKFVAGNDDLIEWTVRPTPHGRYFGDKQYPMEFKSELAMG